MLPRRRPSRCSIGTLVILLGIVLLLSSCSHIVRGVASSASNTAILIDFNIDTNGQINITIGAEFATPIVNTSVTGTHIMREPKEADDPFYVVFVDGDSGRQESAYEVDAQGQSVRIQARNENVDLLISEGRIDVIMHGPSTVRISTPPDPIPADSAAPSTAFESGNPETSVPDISSPEEAERVRNAEEGAVLKTIRALNLRTGPGVENTVLLEIPNEAHLILLDQVAFASDGGMWCNVRYGETEGWVNRAYIWVQGVNMP